ncbi:MAG: GNAT family N-acetyltransferase [Anaerolineae bacterium]
MEVKGPKPGIRPFNGSLADAEGLLSVERTIFNESPYSAQEVQRMLTKGPQRAWLAVAAGEVIGFVIAFPVSGPQDLKWEIDLLAVRPDWTGQGLGTRLIRAAAAAGARVARRARAVTAVDNQASLRAFNRAGFRPSVEPCNLLLRRLPGPNLSPCSTPGVTIQRASPTIAFQEASSNPPEGPSGFFLMAEQHGRPAGYIELVQVQTILYRGIWIETVNASTPLIRTALVQETLQLAAAASLDEIGMMVPKSEHALQETLLTAGFQSLGDFYWLWAELPLPDPPA